MIGMNFEGGAVYQYKLIGNDIELVLKGNVLAVVSGIPLSTVSTAVYNGGARKATTILNVELPKGYDEKQLHKKPETLILDSSKELGFSDKSIGMITAASIKNFSVVTKKDGDLVVSIIATAGCNHAESAGEEIKAKAHFGTINMIVLIDGNPTETCLMSALVTATEAKTAALRALDVRSSYSGDLATGTVTDSLVVASTNRGSAIEYCGPASKLGNLIGHCTRSAVKEAIMKQDQFLPYRSIFERLKEHQLSIEKLTSELSKIKSLNMNKNMLSSHLTTVLKKDPYFALILMAAIKIDEDIEKGLIPPEFGKIENLERLFTNPLFFKQIYDYKENLSLEANTTKYDMVRLPLFLKHILIGMIKSVHFRESIENSK
jgi:iron complex transport system ATP-binding protein